MNKKQIAWIILTSFIGLTLLGLFVAIGENISFIDGLIITLISAGIAGVAIGVGLLAVGVFCKLGEI